MKKIMVLMVLSIALISCGQRQSEVAASAPAEMARSAPAPKMMADSMGGAEQGMTEVTEPTAGQANAEVKKYIALSHHLSVEVEAEQLQANFDATLKHCEALNCQIVSANFHRETPYNPPSASLSVRIPPRNVEIFLTGLAKSGEIMQHGREAEDKTNQVVDADARIKNLTELRDRLRAMLGNKSATFKDIIEVERELANTQSQLDAIVSVRKVLALETDLVAMNIDFSAKQGITEQGFFAPVVNAFKNAGRVMVESLATLITFVMSVLPWVVIGIPILLLIRKLWVKLKLRWFKG